MPLPSKASPLTLSLVQFAVSEGEEENDMHSYGYRANGVLSLSFTILALICTAASLSGGILNLPPPSAHVQVMNINWFQRHRSGNDEVSLTLNISANLESLFTWNTKQHMILHQTEDTILQIFVFLATEYETPKNSLNQAFSVVVAFLAVYHMLLPQPSIHPNEVSIWDSIIPSIEKAKFRIHTINKYRLADQGNNLRGIEFNLTLRWHVMPRTGKMFADKIVTT